MLRLCLQEEKGAWLVSKASIEDIPACKVLDKFHGGFLLPLPLLPPYQGSSFLFTLLKRLRTLD